MKMLTNLQTSNINDNFYTQNIIFKQTFINRQINKNHLTMKYKANKQSIVHSDIFTFTIVSDSFFFN